MSIDRKHINPQTGLVPLVFRKRFRNINSGETAGFRPEDAEKLLAHPEQPCEIWKGDGKAPSAPVGRPGEGAPLFQLAPLPKGNNNGGQTAER